MTFPGPIGACAPRPAPAIWSEPDQIADRSACRPSRGRRAVYNNQMQLFCGVVHAVLKLRAELVECGFAMIPDRGGMRRVWLCGRENMRERYLNHVAGYNLGLIPRLLTGAGTRRAVDARVSTWLFALPALDGRVIVVVLVDIGDQVRTLGVCVGPAPLG